MRIGNLIRVSQSAVDRNNEPSRLFGMAWLIVDTIPSLADGWMDFKLLGVEGFERLSVIHAYNNYEIIS